MSVLIFGSVGIVALLIIAGLILLLDGGNEDGEDT